MNYNDKHFKYWVWFSRIDKISCIKKEKLLKMYGNPEIIYNLGKLDLIKMGELEDDEVEEIIEQKNRDNLEKYCDYMIKNNIKMVTIFDEEYPKKLRNIYDSPIVLYAKGNLELLKEYSLAIVGSRNCSEYGKKVSKKLAYDLAKYNICIISGLAKGVDKYAHLGTLQAEGKTIAVIGNGLDVVYPKENHEVYERIIKNNGLIVTEYVVGTEPNRLNFPARNRIISALSNGIIVVEAGIKSGSLITTDFGLEHGKDIFAVPGNIFSMNSQGTNNLIKQGANIVTKPQDIIDVLGL